MVPLPVSEVTMTPTPPNASGITACCVGVGAGESTRRVPRRSSEKRPHRVTAIIASQARGSHIARASC